MDAMITRFYELLSKEVMKHLVSLKRQAWWRNIEVKWKSKTNSLL